jgi:hypothetical protein
MPVMSGFLMPKTPVSAPFSDTNCSQAQATHSLKNTIFFKKSRHSLRKLSAGWHSTDSYLLFVFIESGKSLPIASYFFIILRTVFIS